MNSPDNEWWIEKTGEYVLGTLGHTDRMTVKKAAEHDPQIQALIVDWERTFQPLTDSLEPVEPPQSVWDAVASRVFDLPEHNPNVISMDTYRAEAQRLESKVGRWRNFAGIAAVASIALASLAWITHLESQSVPPVETIAAVTQFDSMSIIRDDQSLPLWVVDTALDNGLVRVTAIAPPSIDDSQSYQLWLVKPDDAGVQSMGLIPTNSDQSFLLKVNAAADNPVAFAVSLEAAGGSTQDVPMGPVLYQGTVQNLLL